MGNIYIDIIVHVYCDIGSPQ